MAARPVALVVAVLLGVPVPGASQGKAPSLSKEQRESLRAAVAAVRTAEPLPDDSAWQMHLLRASDGSHYVAFSLETPPDLTPEDRLALYVRLEPKPTEPSSIAAPPRSAVEEWLRGERSDPLPMRARRVVTVPTGELPMGGTAATMTRDGSGQNSAVIALMDRQMQKQREEAEAREKARREEMEGRSKSPVDLLPFEDFDMAARVVPRPGRTPVIRRAVTAGPGDYDVVVAWAVLDGKNRPTRTGARRQRITLAPVREAGLSLGSVILADAIRERADVLGADRQTAHPYAIGLTEIEPAVDAVFTNDQRLALAFQILGPQASPAGKPDVGVAFRLFRQTPNGEEPSAGLAPLQYTADTLPPDFNLGLGHPLLAAFTAPLRTLPRGDYRLAIGATDRIGRVSTTTEVRFRIVATPASLLASAPVFTTPFSRARWQQTAVFDPALDALTPFASTPALTRLIGLARQHRFVDLVPDIEVTPAERGMASLLQGIAAFALGDTARGVAVRLGRALEQGAPKGATNFWLGAALALENRDADAVEAWTTAGAAGWPQPLVAPPLAEALYRLRQFDRAGDTARAALAAGAVDAGLVHIAAATELAAGRHGDAAARLEAQLTLAPDNLDTAWLLLHARFAGIADATGEAATPEARAGFARLASRYIESGGRNRALAEEWRTFATSSASPVP